ncbi:MAG: 2-phospho-L-lactate transferase [Caldilineales bacterium]|nr:2-phospho-L-lactate transferase [Caldilineales bacterium]
MRNSAFLRPAAHPPYPDHHFSGYNRSMVSAVQSTMNVIALAGGVGGAKLAHGLAQHLAPERLTVVVNTADDFEHLGLLICPDVDTVLYNLAEVNNLEQGWGRTSESFQVLEEAERLGHEAWFRLGDRDIALHLLRRQMLDAGMTLSEITADLARRLGVAPAVVPMSDQPVRTIIITPEGDLPFQEYFVHRRCQPAMLGMTLEGLEHARPADAFTAALSRADLIVICPSNPFVSIDPILSLPGVRARIANIPTIAVSPIVGGQALKGPAAKMMAEMEVEVSALGVARHYQGLADAFVCDQADAELAEEVAELGMKVLVTDTIMTDKAARARLAGEVLSMAGREWSDIA